MLACNPTANADPEILLCAAMGPWTSSLALSSRYRHNETRGSYSPLISPRARMARTSYRRKLSENFNSRDNEQLIRAQISFIPLRVDEFAWSKSPSLKSARVENVTMCILDEYQPE